MFCRILEFSVQTLTMASRKRYIKHILRFTNAGLEVSIQLSRLILNISQYGEYHQNFHPQNPYIGVSRVLSHMRCFRFSNSGGMVAWRPSSENIWSIACDDSVTHQNRDFFLGRGGDEKAPRVNPFFIKISILSIK